MQSRRLWFVDTRTGERTPRSRPVDVWGQAWSPDSRRIVYASEGGAERRNGNAASERVMVLDVDGQSPPTSAAAGGAAVWSPVGR